MYIILKIDERYEPYEVNCIHAFSDKIKAQKYITELNHKSKSICVYYNIREVPLD